MKDYLNKIKHIAVSPLRKKQPLEKAMEQELSDYRGLSGTIPFLGAGTVPQPTIIGSFLQQKM